jgi:cytochrome c oxidase cbb3-type subunit 3
MSHWKLKAVFATSFLLPLTALAENAQAAVTGQATSFNPVLFLLVTLAVVLVFANGLLAYVLKQLAEAWWEKTTKERTNTTILKSVLLVMGFAVFTINTYAQSEPAGIEVPAGSPSMYGMPQADFYFLAGLIGFMLMIMLVLLWQIRLLTGMLRNSPEKAYVPRLVFKKNFLDVFNKSVAVEKEADIVLDHDYDGIRELDNDLPPWWKWGFALTILISFIYIGYYHFGSGPNQAAEFAAAMARGEQEKAEYLAKSANSVDESTVTNITDAGEVAAAGTIFQNACAACHANDGGGGVGPNLTDNFWLHGGSIKEVFKSIKYGWPDKGMKSWKDDYSPKQIAGLASYIATLNGTTPAAPKAPQGEPALDNQNSGNAGQSTAMSAK